MSVQLNPSNALGFKRPLTTLVKRQLTITNNNPQPVAFKVKTTAPKLYCVRPNSGRVEPGESIDVSVMLQALKEEPPLNTKCKDKFLIQSTIITPDKENLALHDIWASPEANEEGKVFQQKLRVTYLPAEGQTLEEEDENAAGAMSIINDSRFETVHPPGSTNGHAPTGLDAHFVPAQSQDPAHDAPAARDEPQRDTSYEPEQQAVPAVVIEPEHVYASEPAATAPVAREPTPEPAYEHEHEHEESPVPVPVPETTYAATAPPPPAAGPAPAPAPTAPEPVIITRENPINEEMFAKYNMAQAEIERLKAQISALQQQQQQPELRRRGGRRLSDDGASVAGSDAQTAVEFEEAPLHPEGVPLQVVVIIALGVFVTTYLFF